jgi:hypothetical protein
MPGGQPWVARRKLFVADSPGRIGRGCRTSASRRHPGRTDRSGPIGGRRNTAVAPTSRCSRGRSHRRYAQDSPECLAHHCQMSSSISQATACRGHLAAPQFRLNVRAERGSPRCRIVLAEGPWSIHCELSGARPRRLGVAVGSRSPEDLRDRKGCVRSPIGKGEQ